MRNTNFADRSNKAYAKPKYHFSGWKSFSEMTQQEQEEYTRAEEAYNLTKTGEPISHNLKTASETK